MSNPYDDPVAFFEALRNSGSQLPIPSVTTPDQVRTRAKRLSTSIFEHWNLLNHIVKRYESTIQKRWMKKTQDQRRKILLAAWPDMPPSHRPDIQAFQNGNKNKALYMWPGVNLEDLLKPKLLLLFLNSRGRHAPAGFSRADIDACRFGHTAGILVPEFLNEHVMMFTGRDGPETYGELISWDDHPDAFDWLQNQRGHHPGEGLEVLMIQDRIYRFLVDCCTTILHDVSKEQLTDPTIPTEPEPPSLSSNKTSDVIVSLAIAAAEAPYRLPRNIDFGRLEKIVGAQLSAAEDHLWALREDPGYYADTMLEYKEHRQVLLLDTNGKKHPLLDPVRDSLLWEHILESACNNAFADLEIWGCLLDRIVALRQMSEDYADIIQPDEHLPRDYAFGFYALQDHLKQFSEGPVNMLKTCFVASPPVRAYYVRQPALDNTSFKVVWKKREDRQMDASLGTLHHWMIMLFDEHQLHLAGLNTIVDELGRLSERDPKGKEYVTSLVANQISELSILSQCILEIELYQPWAAAFETEMLEYKDDLQQELLHTQKRFQPYFQCKYGGTIATLGNPSSGRFKYPISKHRTQINVEQMRSAEEKLDAFWLAVDRELSSKNAYSDRFRQLLAHRELQRTPEWIEPAKATSVHLHVLLKPMSELHLQLEKDSTPNKTVTKSKTKTRGIARLKESTDDADALDTPEADIEPVFKVDKRALKVFKTLFFVPSTSSFPGELAWGDFVHALCTTGFSAEKLYGSVWAFAPTRLDVDTSINFHEPHPSGKIPFTIARRHGRRLNRSYGWHGGMFVLE